MVDRSVEEEAVSLQPGMRADGIRVHADHPLRVACMEGEKFKQGKRVVETEQVRCERKGTEAIERGYALAIPGEGGKLATCECALFSSTDAVDDVLERTKPQRERGA